MYIRASWLPNVSVDPLVVRRPNVVEHLRTAAERWQKRSASIARNPMLSAVAEGSLLAAAKDFNPFKMRV
jgi:hypothetical protein